MGDPGEFADEFGFIRAVTRFRPAASGAYFVPTDPDRNAAWGTVRHGMWLNLADYSLLAAIVETVKYVRTGNRETSVHALRKGSVAIVPALRFSMTSQGFERGLDVRVISRGFLTRSAVRWTDVPSGARLWAGHIELRVHSNTRWQPQVCMDVFERPAAPVHFSQGVIGTRVEAGARMPLRAGRRAFDVGFRLGYKTRGYLVDAPERATVLGGASFSVTF